MQVENLRDILHWTKEFHQHLADCMKNCASQQLNERAKMLLDYLSEHEYKLSSLLESFEASADQNALNTWVYEYLDKSPIKGHEKCDKPFAEMTTEEIIGEIEDQHQQVIALYRYLIGRAEIPSAIELLEQLASLEEHEAMQMTHGANRLEDL